MCDVDIDSQSLSKAILIVPTFMGCVYRENSQNFSLA